MTDGDPTPESDRNLVRQERFWSRRAAEWDHGSAHNPGLLRVVSTVVEKAQPASSDRVVDLGCGSGQVTLELAPHVAEVLAVDISDEMIRLLLEKATAAGVGNITGRATPLEKLELVPASVDVIVSNYVLHHLRDADKPALVKDAFGWLRPGGRLVIGDMMFGRGSDRRDRAIIASKLSLMGRMGPAGWWRIAKNGARYLFRVQERPVSIDAWEKMLLDAGFKDVEATEVVNEAAVVRGIKPSL